MTLVLTRGDTHTRLLGRCVRRDTSVPGQVTDTPADLSFAASVQVRVRPPRGGTLITRLANVVAPATDGRWSLTWAEDDLTVTGTYVVDAKVIYPDGSDETFPGPTFKVRAEL